MSRTLRALLIVFLVASCGGGGSSSSDSAPPRNLESACSIVKQRPEYLKAFKRTKRRWGVPVHVQMATIHQESKFVGDARTPLRFAVGVIPMGRQSSAYGYSQALDGTWKEYLADTGKRRAKRSDIADATDFMGWYMNNTRDRTGVSLDDARNQYLAYHEGQGGYLRGTHRGKAWLLRVADKVQTRALMYQQQLSGCGVK
ncbi:MAG: lytic transglycosylase [Rhodobacteraceae bacterium]|nr:lytic transglycosylase [Paracoccaceae bacterium]